MGCNKRNWTLRINFAKSNDCLANLQFGPMDENTVSLPLTVCTAPQKAIWHTLVELKAYHPGCVQYNVVAERMAKSVNTSNSTETLCWMQYQATVKAREVTTKASMAKNRKGKELVRVHRALTPISPLQLESDQKKVSFQLVSCFKSNHHPL